MTLESYWLENCPYYYSSVVINARKMFIRLTNGNDTCGQFYEDSTSIDYNSRVILT